MNEERQVDLVQTEYKLTQQQIDKYDGLLAQIKTWAITVWAALSGWSLQAKRKETFLLLIFIIIIFWFLDAFNKNFRQDYKKRRDHLAQALQQYFQNNDLPQDLVSPAPPQHRTFDALRYLAAPHVFLLYLALLAVSLFLYVFLF